MSLDLEALGITQDDLIDRAVEKLLDGLNDECNLMEEIRLEAKDRARDKLESIISGAVSQRLHEELEIIFSEKLTPVNIWGETCGKETTLREALRERARTFWETKVDREGRESKYNGEPRYRQLMSDLLRKEFSAAVLENATEIVAAFKVAIKADLQRTVNEHIEKLIPAKTR